MNKVVLFLALLLLFAGCVPSNMPVQQDGIEEKPAIISSVSPEPAQEPPEVLKDVAMKVGEDLYEFKGGDSVIVKGKKVTVFRFSPSIIAEIQVGKVNGTILQTNYPEIINGLEINIRNFKFIHSGNLDNRITLKINEIYLGPDEYLVYRNSPVAFGGKYIKMIQVGRDDATFSVTGELYDERIRVGYTGEVGGFDITPIRTFYRNEPFAILKIVPSS